MLIFGHRCIIAREADGVELDVVITPDRLLAVSHDPVPYPDPSLEEILSLDLPPDFWLDIESKTAPPDLLALAIAPCRDRHRIMVRSFDHDFLRAFHSLEPDIPLAALIEFDSDDWVAIARVAHSSTISPLHTTITAARVARAHDAGIQVSAWTPNTEADWQRLADLGVDTIITDHPAAAVRYFSAAPGRPTTKSDPARPPLPSL